MKPLRFKAWVITYNGEVLWRDGKPRTPRVFIDKPYASRRESAVLMDFVGTPAKPAKAKRAKRGRRCERR